VKLGSPRILSLTPEDETYGDNQVFLGFLSDFNSVLPDLMIFISFYPILWNLQIL
jgi:hypothetical protein